MLKYRIITAAVLIPLVFIGIFYTSPLVFRLIFTAVLLLAAWEWCGLSHLKMQYREVIYLCFLSLCFYLIAHEATLLRMIIVCGVLGWGWISYQLITRKRGRFFNVKNAYFVLSAGVLIFTSTWAALSFLRDEGPRWIVVLLLIVWLADTAAYFSGRWFGKHLLAPQISPKKTWEGVLGALVIVFVATLVMGCMLKLSLMKIIWFTLLSVLTAIVSIFGDLFESLLKRQVGVKDSGQLLPGHGGLLDRIDSLLAAAPFFALGIWILNG